MKNLGDFHNLGHFHPVKKISIPPTQPSLIREAEDRLKELLVTKAHLEIGEQRDLKQPYASHRPSVRGHSFELPLIDQASHQEFKLGVLVTKSLQPREVEDAVFRVKNLIPTNYSSEDRHLPIVIAPSISLAVVERLEAHGVSWLDFGGNAHLELGSKLIHIEGKPVPREFRERPQQKSLYSPKASRLLRVLLQGPLRPYKVEELAETAGVSLGLVSKVRKILLHQDLAEDSKEGIRIKGAIGARTILKDWILQDDFSRRTEVREYSLLENDPDVIATRLLEFIGGQRHAFTQWYGAFLRQPYTLPIVATAYVDDFPDESLLKEKLQTRRVDGGGRLLLVKPQDEGVFQFLQEVKGKTLVCDVQLYLDVINSGLRGNEAAEELLKADNFSGGWK